MAKGIDRNEIVKLFYLLFLIGFISSVDEDYKKQFETLHEEVLPRLEAVEDAASMDQRKEFEANGAETQQDSRWDDLWDRARLAEGAFRTLETDINTAVKEKARGSRDQVVNTEKMTATRDLLTGRIEEYRRLAEGREFRDIESTTDLGEIEQTVTGATTTRALVQLVRLELERIFLKLDFLDRLSQGSATVSAQAAVITDPQVAVTGPECVTWGRRYNADVGIQLGDRESTWFKLGEGEVTGVGRSAIDVVGNTITFDATEVPVGEETTAEVTFALEGYCSTAVWFNRSSKQPSRVQREAKPDTVTIGVIRPRVTPRIWAVQTLYNRCRNVMELTVNPMPEGWRLVARTEDGELFRTGTTHAAPQVDISNFVAMPDFDGIDPGQLGSREFCIEVYGLRGGSEVEVGSAQMSVREPPDPTPRLIGVDGNTVRFRGQVGVQIEADPTFQDQCGADAEYVPDLQYAVLQTSWGTASTPRTIHGSTLSVRNAIGRDNPWGLELRLVNVRRRDFRNHEWDLPHLANSWRLRIDYSQ